MSYFVDDLKDFYISAGVMTSADGLEGYDEATAGAINCIFTYDSDAEIGRKSIKVLSRAVDYPTAKAQNAAIYSALFDARQPKTVNAVINGSKCLFKPLKQPLPLKYENGYASYSFDMEVWTKKL